MQNHYVRLETFSSPNHNELIRQNVTRDGDGNSNSSVFWNEEFVNPLDKTPTLQYFFVACLALQSTFGTFGNLLVMGAVCVVPALRTTGNAFIVNLSLADLCVTAITQPSNIIGALYGEKWFEARPIICSAIVYVVISTLCATGCISSTWNICMIAINRYILICHFELYDKIYTKCRTCFMCLTVWIFIYLIELPNHVGWGDNRFSVVFYVCTFANHVHSYALFYMGVGVFIPVGASFLGYLGIYIRVRKSGLVRRRVRSRIEDGKLTRQERSKHKKLQRKFHENVKVAQVLFRVYIIFLLMWLPVAILIVMGKGTEISSVWYILTILLAHGNSSINCVVYAASIEHFKQGYCKILGIRRKHIRTCSITATMPSKGGVDVIPLGPMISKSESSRTLETTELLLKTVDYKGKNLQLPITYI